MHLRLSEREAFAISHLLEKKAHARVVAMVRETLGPHARHALGELLARHAERSLQITLSEPRRAQLVNAVAEAMLTVCAADLVPMGSVLQKAAADAASGSDALVRLRRRDRGVHCSRVTWQGDAQNQTGASP